MWLDIIKGDERGDYRPNGVNLDIFNEMVNEKMVKKCDKCVTVTAILLI